VGVGNAFPVTEHKISIAVLEVIGCAAIGAESLVPHRMEKPEKTSEAPPPNWPNFA